MFQFARDSPSFVCYPEIYKVSQKYVYIYSLTADSSINVSLHILHIQPFENTNYSKRVYI